jgi:hypothetical protein
MAMPIYLQQHQLGFAYPNGIAFPTNPHPAHWDILAALNGGKPPLNLIFNIGINPKTQRDHLHTVSSIMEIIRTLVAVGPSDKVKDSKIIKSPLIRYQDAMENGVVAVAVHCGCVIDTT